MHPKFNVDPNYTKELLNLPSSGNLPPHLHSPVISDPTIQNISKAFIPHIITAAYPDDDDENGIGPIFVPDVTHQVDNNESHFIHPTLHNQPVQDTSMHPHYSARLPQYSRDGLPMLNPDMFSRRVKITLTNIDDTLVFYTQLLNQAFQWGILLKPINHIQFGESLCPQHYNGIPITKT